MGRISVYISELAVLILVLGKRDNEGKVQLDTKQLTMRVEADWNKSSGKDWLAAVKKIKALLLENFN